MKTIVAQRITVPASPPPVTAVTGGGEGPSSAPAAPVSGVPQSAALVRQVVPAAAPIPSDQAVLGQAGGVGGCGSRDGCRGFGCAAALRPVCAGGGAPRAAVAVDGWYPL